MINLLLAAAISCSVSTLGGTHAFECVNYHRHTLPDGTGYEDTESTGFFVTGPAVITCHGEGHPFKVSMKDLGSVVCHNETPIFADGLESGDTGAWSYVTP